LLLDGLPPAGNHPNRTIGVGPEGTLYVSVGSTCNACVEESPLSATIVRVPREESAGAARPEVFARGLRNTIGFAWHPQTRQFWGMDHGIDWLGDDRPPEELNLLEQGKNYGWPFVWGERQSIPLDSHPAVGNLAQYAATTTPPVLGYQAHSAPLQMVFYTAGQFPPEYRNDAFVAMHGSWNRKPPTGYEVVRIHFADGRPVEFREFLTGFLLEDGTKAFGRPAGLAVAADGSLLVGDDVNGMIYRVSYRPAAQAATPALEARPKH
jgi:glucose/arabinose dehydrogenase